MPAHPESVVPTPQVPEQPAFVELPPVQSEASRYGDIGRNALSGIVRSRAMRGALALGLAVAAGTAAGTASEFADPNPRHAAANGGYPDADAADCSGQFGTYSWCKDGDASGGYTASESNSSRGYAYRNCTDWVAWRAQNAGVGSVPTGWGNAKNWDDSAPTSSVDTTPEPGDIAVWNAGTYGHVAFVESVNTDGTVNISEYNKAGTGLHGLRSSQTADKYIDLNGTGVGINGELIPGSGSGSTPPSAPPQLAHYADYTIYRLDPNASTGYWYAKSSSHLDPTPVWGWAHGSAGDKPIVADFDGDGYDDYGVYRVINGTGYWYVRSGGSGQQIPSAWGVAHGGWNQDIPVAGDFDGDGKADFGIYRMEPDSTGRWYVKSSKQNNPTTPVWGWAHGSPGDIPVVGDFNGDNVDDYGVYRLNPNDSTGYWYVRNGGDGSPTPVWGWVHGSPGDKPIVGDFNGDNVDDYGVYRSTGGTGYWYVRSGGDGNQITPAWGVPHGGWGQDIPLAGDFGRN